MARSRHPSDGSWWPRRTGPSTISVIEPPGGETKKGETNVPPRAPFGFARELHEAEHRELPSGLILPPGVEL